VRIEFAEGDIFLGHPFFPFQAGKEGVTELSITQSHRLTVTALISPLHCDTNIKTGHINEGYLRAIDALMDRTDILFAIMGEYWWDRWPHSPFAHWMPKMVRLDMAIDTSAFPRVKNRFNSPGKRGYLYIGRNDPMKGTRHLTNLFSALGSFPCGWIGHGPDIPGVKKVGPHRLLTPNYMEEIARTYDFFVSAAVADPNPTTILESMAWGFPVICTPQSGYYETSYRKSIHLDDLDRSVEVLRRLQFADEGELTDMADEARSVVERQYTWDRFLGTVCAELGLKQTEAVAQVGSETALQTIE
jgi:glycosyltransferase involved in cell wall biosynthesis